MEETEKMAYPAYSTLELRLQTFVDWPIAIKQTPAKLSEAGFYYTGIVSMPPNIYTFD